MAQKIFQQEFNIFLQSVIFQIQVNVLESYNSLALCVSHRHLIHFALSKQWSGATDFRNKIGLLGCKKSETRADVYTHCI